MAVPREPGLTIPEGLTSHRKLIATLTCGRCATWSREEELVTTRDASYNCCKLMSSLNPVDDRLCAFSTLAADRLRSCHPCRRGAQGLNPCRGMFRTRVTIFDASLKHLVMPTGRAHADILSLTQTFRTGSVVFSRIFLSGKVKRLNIQVDGNSITGRRRSLGSGDSVQVDCIVLSRFVLVKRKKRKNHFYYVSNSGQSY